MSKRWNNVPGEGAGQGDDGQSSGRTAAHVDPPIPLRRKGVMGWWINLTAPSLPRGILPVEQRERLRKAELTSYSILGVFAFLVALVSNSLASASTAQAVATMAVFLTIAAVLNRMGWVRVAAYLVPSALLLLIALSVVAAPGLRPIGLPIFDLFVIPIILVSFVGNRRASWIYALVAIAFIAADYTLQPHATITASGAQHFDELAYEQNIFGWWGMVNRHIAVCFFAALFGWLGARSVDYAILRADRAEELAALEHQVAEQRRSLEDGARILLEAHVRVANKDLRYRIPHIQDPILWRVGQSFNTMVSRFTRAEQAEHQLHRTEIEMQRLVAAIDEANAGRQPIWPAPANTVVDLILERIAPRTRPSAAAPSMDPWPPLSSPGSPDDAYEQQPGYGTGGRSHPAPRDDSAWQSPPDRQG